MSLIKHGEGQVLGEPQEDEDLPAPAAPEDDPDELQPVPEPSGDEAG